MYMAWSCIGDINNAFPEEKKKFSAWHETFFSLHGSKPFWYKKKSNEGQISQ